MSVAVPYHRSSVAALAHHHKCAGLVKQQYKECIEWAEMMGFKCTKAYNKKGDRWPDISKSGLQRRMHGTVQNGKEYQCKQVLTVSELGELEWALRSARDHGTAADMADRNNLVMDILEYRKMTNKSGGRKYVELSDAAILCLQHGRPGKAFWKNFFAWKPTLKVDTVEVPTPSHTLTHAH